MNSQQVMLYKTKDDIQLASQSECRELRALNGNLQQVEFYERISNFSGISYIEQGWHYLTKER